MRTVGTTLVTSATALAVLGAAGRVDADKISPRLHTAMRSAASGQTLRAWVFFSDKGDAAESSRAHALTERALARRARNGVAVDAYDAPVAAAYVRAVTRGGARVRHASRWLNAVSVEAEADDVARLAELPFVRHLDRVRAFREPLPPLPAVERPADAGPLREGAAFAIDYGPSLTQNAQINVPALHDQGYSGSGVLICMLDTGFNNLAHAALAGLDVLATWDFVNGDSVVADQEGQAGSGNHGTYTLSALGGFQPGALVGPAYGATFLLAKTENTEWERHVEEDDWIAGAEWADSIGADIISSSLSYASGFTNGEPSYTWGDMDGNTTIVAVGADMAASRGILVVNSAGNGGFVSLPANSLGSPADGDSVLAVGAVDATGARAGFSSVGPSADGQIKPDVMALGVAVVAASPSSANGYVSVGGTSLACPLVAGAAALLLEARPNASNVEIVDALRQTASRANAPDREYGWGIVDAGAALSQIPTGVTAAPAPIGVVLHPAQPNPFNPATTLRYATSRTSRVNLSIFDVRGARVATLVDRVLAAGEYSVVWHGRDDQRRPVASGVYVCRLTSGGRQQTRKLVLLK